MNAGQMLQYLEKQRHEINTLVDQLDEIQVAFNAQFDEFKARHDETLDHLTAQIAERLDDISPDLRATIEQQLLEELERLDERRAQVVEQYLPQRQQAANDLLEKAQSELAELRDLNPELDEQEEELKHQKAKLESQLVDLNEQIQQKSRGLGVIRHFIAISKADRERHYILGQLKTTNDSLYHVRREWEQKRKAIEERQDEYQGKWQLESIAVARLQSEVDQLSDDTRRQDLALRRAIRHVLDDLKESAPDSNPELDAKIQEMVELNIQTDDYHAGLASIGGFIGLLRGIESGMKAIHKSIGGLQNEQTMHSAYLDPLRFSLPDRVEAFHKQWKALAEQFADEKTIGQHPAEFSANVKPILDGPLAQVEIEATFNALGDMIKRATAGW